MSTAPQDDAPLLGLPQLAVCLLLGYLVYRWYNTTTPKPPNSTSTTTAAPPIPRTQRPADLARLNQRAEVVHGMFPQISLAAIKYELQRNGGSVETTTEKILANGFLVEPPNQPQQQPRTSTPTTNNRNTPTPTSSSSASSSSSTQNPLHQDLITRYNLTSRLSSSPSTSTPSNSQPTTTTTTTTSWSQNKAERAALHQKRRDEMILNARRRCEELERKRAEKEKVNVGGV